MGVRDNVITSGIMGHQTEPPVIAREVQKKEAP